MKLSHSWLCADCGCVNDNPHQCACGSQHGLLNLGSVLNREPDEAGTVLDLLREIGNERVPVVGA